MFVSDASGDHMVEFQKGTACTRLECYSHLYTLCQHNPAAAWLALLLTKVGDVESNPGPTTHTSHMDL